MNKLLEKLHGNAVAQTVSKRSGNTNQMTQSSLRRSYDSFSTINDGISVLEEILDHLGSTCASSELTDAIGNRIEMITLKCVYLKNPKKEARSGSSPISSQGMESLKNLSKTSDQGRQIRGMLPPSMLANGTFCPSQQSEIWGQIFGTKPQQLGAGVAVLEIFGQIFENQGANRPNKI